MARKPTKTKRKNTTNKPATKAKRAPVLLSGDNPQIAKAEGNAPVEAYIQAIPGWKQGVAKSLDELIVRTVPKVQKSVKWNSPFYGVEGQGSFLSFHCFSRYIKVTFFQGKSLEPMPPGDSKHPEVRYVDLHKDDAPEEAVLASWILQASKLEGGGP